MVDVGELLLSSKNLCDDGWCAAAADRFSVPVAQLAATLAGTSSTKVLSVDAAVAVVERLHATNPATAQLALDGDRRSTPQARLVELVAADADAADPPDATLADVLEALAVFARSEHNDSRALQARVARLAVVASGGATPQYRMTAEVAADAAVAVLAGVAVSAKAAADEGSAFNVSTDAAVLSLAGDLLTTLSAEATHRVLRTLLGDRDTFAAAASTRTPELAVWERARAALLCSGVVPYRTRTAFCDAFDAAGGTVEDLVAALSWVCNTYSATRVKVGSQRTTFGTPAQFCAAWCHRAGVPWLPDLHTTPGSSVAELVGAHPLGPGGTDPVDDWHLDVLVAAMLSEDCAADAERVCVIATANGTVRRHLPSAKLEALAGVSAAVALCLAGDELAHGTELRRVSAFVHACSGEWGHDWLPADVIAALDADAAASATTPVGDGATLDVASFDAELQAHLWSVCRSMPLSDTVPDYLVDRVCATSPLSRWLSHERTLERLCATAADIGADRWTILLSLLESFVGTIDELVALTAQVAPERVVAT